MLFFKTLNNTILKNNNLLLQKLKRRSASKGSHQLIIHIAPQIPVLFINYVSGIHDH